MNQPDETIILRTTEKNCVTLWTLAMSLPDPCVIIELCGNRYTITAWDREMYRKCQKLKEYLQ